MYVYSLISNSWAPTGTIAPYPLTVTDLMALADGNYSAMSFFLVRLTRTVEPENHGPYGNAETEPGFVPGPPEPLLPHKPLEPVQDS